jgi:hypothetical protein
MVSNPPAQWGLSMDTHEISRDKPKPSGEAAAPPTAASAADAGATPRMALAGVPMPAIETPAVETPTIGLARIEAPNITPDIDEPKPPAEVSKAMRDCEAPAGPPRGSAASPRRHLALAAARSAHGRALAAYVRRARPLRPPRHGYRRYQALRRTWCRLGSISRR